MKRLISVLAGVMVVALLPATVSAQNTNVWIDQGGAKLVVGNGGEIEIQSGGTLDLQEGTTISWAESPTFTLGADEFVLVDGATTAQTQTAGALDVNFASITANAAGGYFTCTTNSGAAAATDVFCFKMLVVQNDADADAFGLEIILDATANAAANSYEYGVKVDCEENTAGACIDGVLLTSSGAAGGMVDAIDASASNITNAINIGSNLILGGDETVSIGATDDTLIFTSNDATPTFMGADAAGASDTIYDTTGAGAITVGSADVTAVTITTDGTGTAELVVPDSSIGQDEVAGMMMQAVFCGQLGNNTTVYTSPITGYSAAPFYSGSLTSADLDYAIGGTGCDAQDDTTEANADEVMFANVAAKILGMYCKVSSAGSNGVVLHARTAAGATTPDVTCTVATAQTDCATATTTTTDIAAGATVAVSAITTEDLSAQDFWCVMNLMLQP